MKKIFVIMTIGFFFYGCGSSTESTQQEQEVSEELKQTTEEVESATEELSEATDELESSVEETTEKVDSLLQDI